MKRLICVVFLVTAVIWGGNVFQCESITFADEKANRAPPPVDDDVPRLFPKETAESIKTFHVPNGFRMDLIAQEPLITSPVAMAYDENGRMYVAEMVDFPYAEKTADKPIGRVRLLIDNDGDGKFDTSSIFVDSLRSPSSVVCWKGGIFVAVSGDIWYFKDTKGGGEANVRKKVFSGFRAGDPEYMQNGLAWGIDHKIYGSTGPNGGEVRPTNRPDVTPVSLAGRDFRFDPVSEDFEAISAGGSQWGNAFDDQYNRFVCKNIAPARHVVLPIRYLDRNPYLRAPRLYSPLTSEGGDVAVYRASPPEPWRTVRARRRQQLGKDANPGELNEAGYFTSACAITVYRGMAYPPPYRGNLFIAEPAGNLVHRRSLESDGITFVSRRLDEKSEVIASSDNFFRPVNLINAPDGTLHIVDMYRELVEGPQYVPADLLAAGKVNAEGGRERGRIYRLTPPNFDIPKPPRLGNATTLELVAKLENPNSWWRETAQRLLYERQDQSAVDPLRKLLADSSLPQARLHALWSLEGLQALRERDIANGLADRSAAVREHAVRLAETRFRRDPELLANVLALTTDPEPRIRLQVAFTLGEAGADARAIAGLAQIAEKDAGDAWIRAAVLSSALECAGKLIETLIQKPAFLRLDGGMVLLDDLAFTVGGHKQPDEVDRVLTIVATAAPTRRDPHLQSRVVVALGNGLRQSRSDLLSRLYGDTSSPGSQMFNNLVDNANDLAKDAAAKIDERENAIALLGYGRFQNVQETLSTLLEAQQPEEVQRASVRTLARYEQPEVADLLLSRWQSSAPAVQGEIADALLARTKWISTFLDAVKSQRVSAAMIGASWRSLLLNHPDRSTRDRAKALFGDAVSKSRNEVIQRYKAALSLTGDQGRGQQVFERVCAACHRIRDKGNDIGPNLSSYGQPSTSPQSLLTDILDPNRQVSPEYVSYVVVLNDGRVLSGILATQTPNSVTLKREKDGDGMVILRNNIEEMKSSGKSLMPEGLEQNVSVEEMADLLSFLMAIRKQI